MRSGFFKGALQLTHPAYLVLDSPTGKTPGSKAMKAIATELGGDW